jgi:hypothetical protein
MIGFFVNYYSLDPVLQDAAIVPVLHCAPVALPPDRHTLPPGALPYGLHAPNAISVVNSIISGSWYCGRASFGELLPFGCPYQSPSGSLRPVLTFLPCFSHNRSAHGSLRGVNRPLMQDSEELALAVFCLVRPGTTSLGLRVVLEGKNRHYPGLGFLSFF